MDVLLPLFRNFEDLILALLISLPRLYAFIASAQILSPSAVPKLARNAAILSLALPIIPANLAHVSEISQDLPTFALFFAKEYVVGFVFGYMIGWLFWTVTSVGDLIDNQRGAAIASSIDPLQGHQTSPLGNLFSQAFVTYFFSIGGMLVIVGVVYRSFLLWPVTRTIPLISDDFPVLVLQVLDLGVRTMFIMAAPVVAIMFLSEFALALVSRFAPQIQVFILAMPIKSAIALLILIFYMAMMLPYAAGQQSYFTLWTDRLYEILAIGEKASSTPGRTGEAGQP
ncbi:type III secretion protein T [Breoghania corrubedonensis]|uniref:Type III secretion protein T n=1 Tax=Breoghania corrubedonensis TaxID=665038 RepID=A0A2T5UYT6_9HYPH|nr:type III secretion system export apparatus subunit SctT [Breoghania corrubedonensis]PTW56641.1 type III secretion protein T [Breoghania corrubedonensis]